MVVLYTATMVAIRSVARHRASALQQRRKVEIELPQWLLKVLERRVAETNDGAEPAERVDLHDVIEWYLISPITIHDVTRYEREIPGLGLAVTDWLANSMYEP